MTQLNPEHSDSTSLRESLATAQHEIWSHWMEYLFSRCLEIKAITGASGLLVSEDPTVSGLLIPQSLVDRWRRQMQTPYSELSEQEKESDRHQANKILAILDELDERK